MALDMIIEGGTRINKLTADEVEEEGNMEEDNYMKTAKVKMEQVREENERLKLTLSRMMKDYQSLKMQFSNKIQQDHHEFTKKPKNLAPMASCDDESELVSLSLGRSVSADSSRKHENKESSTESKNLENCKLELGLDLKSDFTQDLKPGKSSDESKGEGNNDDVRSSDKSPKNSRSGGDDEVLQYSSPLKKPRVSVRAVCNTQTMNDGCQWRKYGQKIAKGNPCPRAYYRCTVSSSCPVRKQVQRCIDNMTILTTTYEGTHNHPLAPSAATMASATSAAAAMLNCGSSASPPLLTTPSRFGFNLPSSNNFITIASSQSHPTVILDLTTPNQNPSTLFPTTHSSPTSLNFSSFDPKNVGSWQNKPDFLPYSQKIANATKAITRDPTFQTALAAAITSFVGTNYQTSKGRDSGLNFNLNFSQPSTSNGTVGCATSFMSKFPQSVNSQPMNATHFAPVTLSTSKSQAVSLADDGEEIKSL